MFCYVRSYSEFGGLYLLKYECLRYETLFILFVSFWCRRNIFLECIIIIIIIVTGDGIDGVYVMDSIWILAPRRVDVLTVCFVGRKVSVSSSLSFLYRVSLCLMYCVYCVCSEMNGELEWVWMSTVCGNQWCKYNKWNLSMNPGAKMDEWTLVRMCAVSEGLRFSLFLLVSLSLVWYRISVECNEFVVWIRIYSFVCECGSDFVECRPISNLRIGGSLPTNDQSDSCDLEYLCALSLFPRFKSKIHCWLNHDGRYEAF